MFYKHRPNMVEAIKWVGTNKEEIELFLGGHDFLFTKEGDLLLHTDHGSLYVYIGDYIVRGVTGSVYPSDAETFTTNYVSV